MTEDLESTIRSSVRGVVFGQMDERIRLATTIISASIRKEQADQVDWRPSGGECLSDIVAHRIRQVRGSRGLTRDALCARFNELSAIGMTASVLGDIETGRFRGGSRRRMVTVDEVVVFAKALEVTPATLMDPASGHVAWLEGDES